METVGIIVALIVGGYLLCLLYIFIAGPLNDSASVTISEAAATEQEKPYMIYVFIAGPLNDSAPIGEREANVQQAMAVWHRLCDAGFIPYCPHLSHFLNRHTWRPRNEWLVHSLRWLDKCDCVFRLPGESSGSDQEVIRARMDGKPVFTSIDVMKEVYFGK